MPRATKKVTEEQAPEAVSEAPVTAEADDKPKKVKKTSFDVYNKDHTFVRTYSVEDHGNEAEAKAEEYAGKIGGSVK